MKNSDFIWQFLMLKIGVIPNPKTGCIFPIFFSIFPIKFKKILSLQFFNLDSVIAPLVSVLAAGASQIGALPILQVLKFINMQQF